MALPIEVDRDPICYIAGPMRGMPQYNYPAFEDAAEMLRHAGWFVYSPRENDAEQNIEIDSATGDPALVKPLKEYMVVDLPQVCKSDAIFMLPGWFESKGAMLEWQVAQYLEIPTYDYESGKLINLMGNDATGASWVVLEGEEDEPEFDHESGGVGTESWLRGVEERKAEEEARAEASWSPIPIVVDENMPDGIVTVVEMKRDFDGEHALPTGSEDRKNIPIVTGLLDYFPAALAEVAKVSKAGNDKHNPGQPMHWARGKSMDQADCIGRHLIERGGFDPETGQRHSAQLAWRALALLQQELEDAGAPLSRGSRVYNGDSPDERT